MALFSDNNQTTSLLSDFSGIAQVIIAFANLLLAGYLFFYKVKSDKKKDNETARLNEQNIKLQWFKELIVQPNMDSINNFYIKLHSIKDKIKSNDLNEDEKLDINKYIKAELALFRKTFVDVLKHIDSKLGDELLANLDNLIDGITEAIFNEELKLNNPTVYEKYIGTKISYSKNNLIAQLFNYKGVSI